MKLSEWAMREGIASYTARRWANKGVFPVPVYRTPGGHWIVNDPKYETTNINPKRMVGYARISSSDQKKDLQRQADRIAAFMVNLGQTNPEVICEVGSGMNGTRKKLNKILSDPSVGLIIVEHSERLARLNLQLIQSSLEANGRKIIVIDDSEFDNDLVQEITEFMTSVCARLYGKRSAKNRAEHAMKAAANAC